VPRCAQKKGWVSQRSSTSNIRTHLITDHKLHQKSHGIQSFRSGGIEDALTTQGKRSSAHFSTDALERQVCKILVRHKLPYTFAEWPLIQELLELAQSAPSSDALKLPSNDTIARRVTDFELTLHNIFGTRSIFYLITDLIYVLY